MAILTTDIIYRLSGGAANSDPAASLGGAKSSTAWVAGIFDDVSSAEASAGDIEYRCIYVHNNHGTLTLQAPKIFFASQTPSATTTAAVGLGTSAQGGTEQTVADESTAPTGVTFSEPADFATGIALGDIPAGGHRAVWIRRTIAAGTVAANDGFTLRVTGDTNP